jgi:MYXO-CTERM domain-containing protein
VPVAAGEAQRAAMRFMQHGGGSSPWLAVAIVGALAALAIWRLARRREPRT